MCQAVRCLRLYIRREGKGRGCCAGDASCRKPYTTLYAWRTPLIFDKGADTFQWERKATREAGTKGIYVRNMNFNPSLIYQNKKINSQWIINLNGISETINLHLWLDDLVF